MGRYANTTAGAGAIMATLPPPPAGYSIVPNDLPPPPAGYAPVDDPAAQTSALSYYMAGKGQTPGTENLPSWMQSVHNAIDPIKILQGLPAVASMALPAGEGPVIAPTAEALHNAGNAGVATARNSNVALSGSRVQQWAQNLQNGLRRDGMQPTATSAPNTHAILDDLRSPNNPYFTNGKDLSVADYIDLRRTLQRQAQNFSPTARFDQAAASRTLDRLDNLFDYAPHSSFASGTPQEIAQVRQGLGDARANQAAGFRSDALTNRDTNAEIAAESKNSGMNYSNTARTAMGNMTKVNPQTGRSLAQNSGYSPEEAAGMRGVSQGGFVQNRIRDAANLMGGGKGMGAVVAGTASAVPLFAAGRPLEGLAAGVGVPLTGVGLKAIENRITANAINNLAQTVRMRSPLAAATPPMTYSPAALRAKALLALPTIFNQGNQ